jgi:transcriptional regulator with XRE-family HTH domain
MTSAATSSLARMGFEAGRHVHDERIRRAWTLRDLADRAGVSPAVVHDLEAGRTVSLETIARVATALGGRPSLVFGDPRDKVAGNRAHGRDAEDFVHAAMGEVEARALARPNRTIAIDEPYQHYKFAGRADVLAWDRENLLHIENRTRFPNIQEAAGAYNAKRQYLAGAVADRAGIGPRGWRSVTHVMACLWSSEVLHALRLRRASFAALCPDPAHAFSAWLAGEEPPEGTTSTLVLLDPAVPFGSRRKTIASPAEPLRRDPRHRGYAEAADALRRAG